MTLEIRILQAADESEIQILERSKLHELHSNPMDQEFASWTAPWRTESLNHYLPLGWSFGAFSEDKKLMGYFLAQPLLFFREQTQSLWVEHLQFNSLHARDQLAETAYKLGREKHFQRVYFPNQPAILNAVRLFKPEPFDGATVFVRTTKS